MPTISTDDSTRLVLRRREFISNMESDVSVRLFGFQVKEGTMAVTAEIVWQDVRKTFLESSDDFIRLMEQVLHTISTVLTYGLDGHLGRDYHLFTEQGEAWMPLRHLHLP